MAVKNADAAQAEFAAAQAKLEPEVLVVPMPVEAEEALEAVEADCTQSADRPVQASMIVDTVADTMKSKAIEQQRQDEDDMNDTELKMERAAHKKQGPF